MATWIGTPNYEPGRGGHQVDHITLHIMVGRLAGTDSHFAQPATMASATYGVGADGSVHQYVSEADTAWADADTLSNQTGISIEHEGGMAGVPCTRACMDASAALCADIARRHGWKRLYIDGLAGNVYLHRQIPGTDHYGCPDQTVNGLDVTYLLNKANQLLKGDDMVTQTDINAIAKKAAEEVWNFKQNGTKMRDRVQGTDAAANGVLKVARDIRTRLFGVNAEGQDTGKANEYHWLTDRVYRIADAMFNKKTLETRMDAIETQLAAIKTMLEGDTK